MNTLANLTPYPARLSRNPVVINIDAADPALYPDRAGLRYYCTVMIPESYLSATYTPLVRLEAAETPAVPAGAGWLYQGAFFEIQNQLDPLLERSAPEQVQQRISVAHQLVTPFYCVLSVEYHDQEISSVQLPGEYMIKAGINEKDYSAYKDQFFTEFIGKEKRFLTWAENPKVVQPDQPEFLYFFTHFSPTPSRIKVCYEALLDDYTRATDCQFELANILPFTVYCIPTGPLALGLDSLEKGVLSYRVWLTNQAGQRISEIREYVLDEEYRRNVRYLVFANSLGGFDTLCLTGQGEEKLQVSRQISDRFGGWEFLPSYSERVINATTGKRELTVSTGWLSTEGLAFLEELLLSNEVYLASDRGLLPLIPVTDSFKAQTDDEDLIGRTLTFEYGNPETSFSVLPDPADLSQRPTGWRPKASACLLDANGRRTGMKAATVLEKYYRDDNRKVVGVPLKANVPGTEGYIPPLETPDCQVSPFLNAEISREGTFKKKGCVPPLVGGPATIVVPAGTYGSEISQADAQAKAEADFVRLNTQAYANQYGACLMSPETYAWNVPANHFHVRLSDPDLAAVYYAADGVSMGNVWNVQGAGGEYVFPLKTNDMDFPHAHPAANWRFMTYGPAGSTTDLKIYVNGVLKIQRSIQINQDGYSHNNFEGIDSFLNGDKLYIDVQPIP